MGTRGLVGWVVDGEVKASYNHWDSYPSGLGKAVLHYVAQRLDTAETWVKKVREVEVIKGSDEEPASPELAQRAQALGLVNTDVGGPSDSITIYQAVRDAQGRLDLFEQLGAIPDSVEFAKDSLFCEWAYLVNLDDGVVEVYRGFQDAPHDKGRFAGSPEFVSEYDRTRYAPIALLEATPFTEVVPAEDEEQEVVIDLILARWETLAYDEEGDD